MVWIVQVFLIYELCWTTMGFALLFFKCGCSTPYLQTPNYVIVTRSFDCDYLYVLPFIVFT